MFTEGLVDFNPWLTGVDYAGETVFKPGAPVVLKAAVAASTGPAAGAVVRFFADAIFVGAASADAAGVATFDWGPRQAGSFVVEAVIAAGCLSSGPAAVEVEKGVVLGDLTIEEVKIDWKKKPDDDKIKVVGTFTLPQGAEPDPGSVVLKVGPLEFGPIAMQVQEGGKKWVYGRIAGAAGIKNMTVLWKAKEAKFEAHIDSAALGDMGGWGNPVTIGFALGACSGSQAVLMVQHKDKWFFNK